MMDRDSFTEILQLVVRNPMRVALSGIGVSWGIMTILLMLGMINGLEYGIKSDMENRASNSMFVWTMTTTKAYGGYKPGRRFDLNNADIEWLEQNVNHIGVLSPRLQLGGYRGGNNVTYLTNTGAFNIYGDYPCYIQIEPMLILAGRYINQGDMAERRKVCVIGTEVKRVLFGSEDPIDKNIRINGVMFKVVGVYGSTKQGEDAEEDAQSIFIPFNTFQKAFNVGDRVGWISLLSDEETPVGELSVEVLAALKRRKTVHPDDERAFGTWNMGEELEEINGVMTAMRSVGIFVGALILLAGIISITNIMLITVGERTKEFGVRRAMGAQPIRIISQVLGETAFLTIVSGLIGLVWGALLVKAVQWLSGSIESEVFRNPHISLKIALLCTGIMIVAGVVGGLLPALRATSIKPVDALRADG
jgi:putative ABC transport system permease protein